MPRREVRLGEGQLPFAHGEAADDGIEYDRGVAAPGSACHHSVLRPVAGSVQDGFVQTCECIPFACLATTFE